MVSTSGNSVGVSYFSGQISNNKRFYGRIKRYRVDIDWMDRMAAAVAALPDVDTKYALLYIHNLSKCCQHRFETSKFSER
jgi:hypothetical protein